jgi:hypothetical protein
MASHIGRRKFLATLGGAAARGLCAAIKPAEDRTAGPWHAFISWPLVR